MMQWTYRIVGVVLAVAMAGVAVVGIAKVLPAGAGVGGHRGGAQGGSPGMPSPGAGVPRGAGDPGADGRRDFGGLGGGASAVAALPTVARDVSIIGFVGLTFWALGGWLGRRVGRRDPTER